jgi:1-acyl-sn-glycerol-3-phosphate acyltransferase
MLLTATAGRPLIFLTAREVYESLSLKWLCKTAAYIPVSRGTQDVGAVRAMLRALGRGEVIALFPEGGIDKHREEEGHLGIGYLALKTGAPVVPASITWDSPRPPTLGGSLLKPGKASVRYGEPIILPPDTPQDRHNISLVTDRIMQAIRELQHQESGSSL